MNEILYAFYMTMELWVFCGVLALALVAEEVVAYMQRRADRQQILINLEVDRLHR